jgi:3',5'-nucleoside bisphosphate phosphatase
VEKFADLHLHTYFSDGSYSPEEVVRYARANGVDCLAITDHDTLAGIKPVKAAAESTGLEIIAGIELSSEVKDKEVHILGYFPDEENLQLAVALQSFRTARVERVHKILALLNSLGVNNILFEEVAALTKTDALGRMHLAVLLVEKGWARDINDAFWKYLAEDAPAYVKKAKLTPESAIELIHEAGGGAVLAHPMLTQVDELIAGFVRAGLDGLEAFYPRTGDKQFRFYENLALKHDLLLTGGSDAHGEHKSYIHIGMVKIPYARVELLKKRFRKF